MADKELEAQQKVKPFQPPNLLTSKTGGEQTPTRNENFDSHSHYQSVSQKAKLILPTALWILIVIAGLCFLSLLSSLNKSINTLDTLVEIEQANAKHAGHRQHNLAAHRAAELSASINDDADLDQANNKLRKDSWLTIPSWTSLDPIHHRHPDRKQHSFEPTTEDDSGDRIKILESPTKESLQNDEWSPVSGHIIKTTIQHINSNKDNMSESDKDVGSILGTIDSVLKKFLGRSNERKSAPQISAPLTKIDYDSQKPSITANIDTININMGRVDIGADAAQDEEQPKRADTKDKSIIKVSSIDDEAKSPDVATVDKINQAHLHRGTSPSEQPETMMIPLESQARPRPVLQDHHLGSISSFLSGADNDRSSLFNLLMPPSLRLFEESSGHIRPTINQGFGSIFSPQSLSGGLLRLDQHPDAEFVADMSGSMANNKHRESSKSPYEFKPTIDQFIVGNKPVDQLLRQTLLPAQENLSTTTKKIDETIGPFIISDFEVSSPANNDQSQTKSDDDTKTSQMESVSKNPLSDLFSVLFDPVPNSTLVATSQFVEPKSGDHSPGSTTSQPNLAATTNAGTTDRGSKGWSSLSNTEAAPVSQTTPLPNPDSTTSEIPKSSVLEEGAPTSVGDTPIVDIPIENILGNMFSLPQMSSQSAPVRADSNSSSTSSTSGSESESSNKDKNSNQSSNKESMMCECQRTNPASLPAKSKVGVSSPTKLLDEKEEQGSRSSASSPPLSKSSSSSSPSPDSDGTSSKGSSGSSSQGPSSRSPGSGGLSTSRGASGSGRDAATSSRPPEGGGSERSSPGSSTLPTGGAVARRESLAVSSSSHKNSTNNQFGSSDRLGQSSKRANFSSISGASSGARSGPGSSSNSSAGHMLAPLSPVGFVQVGPQSQPSAFAFNDTGLQESMRPRTSGQLSGSSPAHHLDNFAQPGSMLAVLNNSTGGAVATLVHRLNTTNYPLIAGHSPSSPGFVSQQISLLISSSGQNTPSSLATSDRSSAPTLAPSAVTATTTSTTTTTTSTMKTPTTTPGADYSVTTAISEASTGPNATNQSPHLPVEKALEIAVEPHKEAVNNILPSPVEHPSDEVSARKDPLGQPVNFTKVIMDFDISLVPSKIIDGDKLSKTNGQAVEIGTLDNSSTILSVEPPGTTGRSRLDILALTTSSPTTVAPKEVSPIESASITTAAPERPFKSFLKKADDFIERGLVNFKRLLSQ